MTLNTPAASTGSVRGQASSGRYEGLPINVVALRRSASRSTGGAPVPAALSREDS